MSTTIKRISLAITQQDLAILERLCRYFGENKSQTLKRCMHVYYYENLGSIIAKKKDETE